MSEATEVRDSIAAANEKFMKTYRRGDMVGMASLYTDSAQLLIPNSDLVAGKRAVQQTFQSFVDMGVKSIKLETVEAEGYGDTASEVGRYTLAGEGGDVLDKGKYMVIWKHESGQWKLHRDIFNSSLPLQA